MKERTYSLEPKAVPQVHTRYRRIVTPLPVPESLPLLQTSLRYEPRSVHVTPPAVWDRAQNFQVHDAYGNCWLDFSSGVLITNSGHGRPALVQALREMADKPLLATYCWPHEPRIELAKAIVELTPSFLDRVLLLSTGSEAIEAALKIALKYARSLRPTKNKIISYEWSFHGRTLGAQIVGGIDSLKDWIAYSDPGVAFAPFPDGYFTKDTSFDTFLETVEQTGWHPDEVAAVIVEAYHGRHIALAPVEYMQALREWCDEHQVILIFDEVQSGFGRLGKMFGFEHYGIVPDLVVCGKGMGGAMPVSAVVGNHKYLDVFPGGAMSSTHAGNPICARVALANIRLIQEEKLVDNAAQMGRVMAEELKRIQQKYSPVISHANAVGAVGALFTCAPETCQPDGDLAWDMHVRCFEKGLLVISPCGIDESTFKFHPPLTITEDALREGLAVIEESLVECIGSV